MQTLTLGGRLSRRAFVGTVAGLGASVGSLALLSGCGLMPAQPRRVPRVAFVWSAPRDATVDRERDALVTGLQAHSYIEGVNIRVDWRYSSSETGADLPSLMTELVVGEPDMLLTAGTPATQAAQQATSTIPIVGVYVADPVATGLVRSLAQPGGNVTAISSFNPVIAGKRLELLDRLVPGLKHVAFVFNVNNAGNVANWDNLQQVAATVGISTVAIGMRTLGDLEPSIEDAVRNGIGAIITALPAPIPQLDVYTRVADLAIAHHIPAMGFERLFAENRGLMSYGADRPAIFRRAAYYVDRILGGARPADLPVEQPTIFELVVNQTTTQALGITIPPDVAAQVAAWVE
jgi:putative tryptophan/tyrosine transport system substrate-binding protein